MNRAGVIKYAEDVRPLAIVFIAFGMSLLPFLVGMPIWLLVPYLALSWYIRGYTPFAQHNHGHLPVFNSRVLNHLYDVFLTQVTGYPTALWELHHTRGHHRNFLDPAKDVASTISRKTGRNMSRWMYALRGNLTIHLDSVRIGLAEGREGKKTLLPKLVGEVVVQFTIAGLFVAWNPWMALWNFIIPNLVAAWFIWWESYAHHLEVPTTTPYDASITITERFHNWQTFNIGFHTAHHEKPTLHWAQLPARTAAIQSQIPAMCIHDEYYRSSRRQAAETLLKRCISGPGIPSKLLAAGGESRDIVSDARETFSESLEQLSLVR